MKNKDIAKIFRNYAIYLEIQNSLIFKIRAYERAAVTLDNLDEDIEDIWKQGNLDDLAGIGEKLKAKISEYLETGKIQSYENKKKKIPVDIEELDRVAGLGPKTILKLYRKLKIKNMKELQDAAEKQKIRKIKGLGPIVEQNILKNVAFAKSSTERSLLGDALLISEKLIKELSEIKEIKKIEVCGSLRRRKETIRDIDILVAANNHTKVIEAFVNLPNVDRILAKGQTKSSIRIEGMQADLRVVILYWGINLLRESSNILMQSTPKHINLEDVCKDIKNIKGVKSVHDAHIWELSSNMYTMTGHIITGDIKVKKCENILGDVNRMLQKKYKIGHTNFQFECK